ncbi:hypothetical protein LCGC14_0579640 [marine sediment metagenome]|uniref:Uncharacterized protein n=1 Tax=marine sediment metagenome TaxID=412755 RepID=A0A0F9S0A0_9ZZZZ
MPTEQEEKPICSYDECEITDGEVKHRMEEWHDFYDEKPTDEDKIREGVSQDFGWWEFEREYLNEHLTEILKEKGKEGCAWSISVEGFGWRNSSGKGCAILEDAADFYEKVLPNCQCTWKMYATDEGLKVRNWHHDSPMGNEYYYLTPIELNKYYEWKEEHA